MTREEALRELIDIRDEATAYPDAVCYVTSEDEDALNIAIEALKAIPSAEASQNLAKPIKAVKGSDIISRDVVVAHISERIRANGYGNVGLVSELNRLIGYVRNIPSADAVQGEWRDRSNGGRIRYPWWENYECTQCGGYGSGAYNFCPSCGADMRGEKE